MGKALRMPDKEMLPPGPRRTFVELLFDYYRIARRPKLEAICNQIKRREERAGTASRETVRRMLLGRTVPSNWQTVEVVFVALCEIADISPAQQLRILDEDEGKRILTTRQGQMEDVWNAALDGWSFRDGDRFQSADVVPPENRPADPWATTWAGGFTDEPPF